MVVAMVPGDADERPFAAWLREAAGDAIAVTGHPHGTPDRAAYRLGLRDAYLEILERFEQETPDAAPASHVQGAV